MISAIVAMDGHGAMGKDGFLPWDLPRDMARFRHLTLGNAVIMGRKTFQSLVVPLQERLNVVLSRTLPRSNQRGVVVARDWDEAMEAAEKWSRTYYCREIFVAGGAEVFRASWPKVGRLYLTVVQHEVEGADTIFPTELIIGDGSWFPVENDYHNPDARNPHGMIFQTWRPKRPVADAPWLVWRPGDGGPPLTEEKTGTYP
jgi:dihydrofolate reductase